MPGPVAQAPPPTRAGGAPDSPQRIVDVVQFRNLPLAGTPMVSAADDPTLAKLDPINNALGKLAERGGIFAKLTKGLRFFTEVMGPTAWIFSSFLTTRLFFKSLKDQTITLPSKVALGIATVANAAGAGLATASTRFAGKLLGTSLATRMTLNKFAGILGGLGGNIYSAINMIETLRNKQAKPAERFFAKLGFVMGLTAFAFGSVAMCASMPWMASLSKALPWLLPNATRLGSWLGLVSMLAGFAQMFLGKNQWLSDKLKGTVLG
jgi:hypothetical protein